MMFVPLALLLIFVSLLLWFRYAWMNVFLRQKVPGPSPNILFGTTEFRMGILECLKHCREKYGRTFSVCFGYNPTLMTSDADLLHDIMITHFDSFRNRTMSQVNKEPFKHNLLSLKDENWKRVRGVLTPSFSIAKLKLMSHMMIKRSNELMQMMGQEGDDKGVLDIYGLFQRLTLDIILECAFAMEVNCISQHDEAKPLLNSLRLLFRAANASKLVLMFPILGRFISSGVLSQNATEAHRVIEYCKQVIRTRKITGDRKVDVLQFMLDSVDHHTKKHLTENEVLANTFAFLLAGYETTSTALSFTSYLLALHPDVQERLYQEVNSKISDTDKMEFDAVSELNYLDQVWKEALRLYPPVAGLVGREAANEVRIQGIRIPAKSWVIMSPLLVHHDPDYWPQPLQFLPDRWAPQNKDLIKSMTYIPFGDGPRHCIGKRFAEIQSKIALVKLLKTYKLETCEQTEEHPMSVKQVGPTMYPAKEAIYLRIVKR